MSTFTSKEKWFREFARKSRFRLSPAAFEKYAGKALAVFQAGEQQGIPEKVICERLGAPELLIAKLERGERQPWRYLLAVLSVLFVILYILLWWRNWRYIINVLKCLAVLIGTVLLPHICGFLCGKTYYKTCASLLGRKQENMKGLYCLSAVVEACFLIFGAWIFPFGICPEIFTFVFFVVFYTAFFAFVAFFMIYGIKKICTFQIQGCRLIYIGNGLLHGFLLLGLHLTDEPGAATAFLSGILTSLPLLADVLLSRLDT